MEAIKASQADMKQKLFVCAETTQRPSLDVFILRSVRSQALCGSRPSALWKKKMLLFPSLQDLLVR